MPSMREHVYCKGGLQHIRSEGTETIYLFWKSRRSFGPDSNGLHPRPVPNFLIITPIITLFSTKEGTKG
jgi:hypothetical protein